MGDSVSTKKENSEHWSKGRKKRGGVLVVTARFQIANRKWKGKKGKRCHVIGGKDPHDAVLA